MSDPVDIGALRKLAEAATPGPWHVDDENHRHDSEGLPIRWSEDAAYFLALEPGRVLALLDEVERLRAENSRLVDRDAGLMAGIGAVRRSLRRLHHGELPEIRRD